jgi:hypothetical protein
VIGFKTNPKPCGFRIKLTRADGVLITPSSVTALNIYLYDSTMSLVNTVTLSGDFDAAASTWSIPIPSPADPTGYYLQYDCTPDGIRTAYPFKYKTADLFFGLLPPGVYEDQIHYMRSAFVVTPTPTVLEYSLDWRDDVMAEILAGHPVRMQILPPTGDFRYFIPNGAATSFKVAVDASVETLVTFLALHTNHLGWWPRFGPTTVPIGWEGWQEPWNEMPGDMTFTYTPGDYEVVSAYDCSSPDYSAAVYEPVAHSFPATEGVYNAEMLVAVAFGNITYHGYMTDPEGDGSESITAWTAPCRYMEMTNVAEVYGIGPKFT